MKIAKKKSKEYLQKHNIIKDDEEYRSQVRLACESELNLSEDDRSSRKTYAVMTSVLFLPFVVSCILSLALGYGSLIAACIFFLMMYTTYKISKYQCLKPNCFITSQRIYFTRNVLKDPYTSLKFSDVHEIKITHGTGIHDRPRRANTLYDGWNVLHFITEDQTISIEVKKTFIRQKNLKELFPNVAINDTDLDPSYLSGTEYNTSQSQSHITTLQQHSLTTSQDNKDKQDNKDNKDKKIRWNKIAKKKSKEYLQKHKIIKDDEEYISQVRLALRSERNLTEDNRPLGQMLALLQVC